MCINSIGLKKLKGILLILFFYLIYIGLSSVEANIESQVLVDSGFRFEQDYSFSDGLNLLESSFDENTEDSENEFCLLNGKNVNWIGEAQCQYIWECPDNTTHIRAIPLRYTSLPPPQTIS